MRSLGWKAGNGEKMGLIEGDCEERHTIANGGALIPHALSDDVLPVNINLNAVIEANIIRKVMRMSSNRCRLGGSRERECW